MYKGKEKAAEVFVIKESCSGADFSYPKGKEVVASGPVTLKRLEELEAGGLAERLTEESSAKLSEEFIQKLKEDLRVEVRQELLAEAEAKEAEEKAAEEAKAEEQKSAQEKADADEEARLIENHRQKQAEGKAPTRKKTSAKK